jgi:hypothetical protein
MKGLPAAAVARTAAASWGSAHPLAHSSAPGENPRIDGGERALGGGERD